jgi:hypothetical protein
MTPLARRSGWRQPNASAKPFLISRKIPISPKGFFMRLLFVVLLYVTCIVTAATADGLQSRVSENTVIVSGATPGGFVAAVGVSRVRTELEATVFTDFQRVQTLDPAGEVHLEGRTAARAIWCVADLTTAAISCTGAPNYPIEEIAPPSLDPTAVRKKVNGECYIQLGNQFAMLWVQPGVGAWTMWTYDGGPLDQDHTFNDRITWCFSDFGALLNATISIPPTPFLQLTYPKPPLIFGPADHLIGIDVDHLTFYKTTSLVGLP